LLKAHWRRGEGKEPNSHEPSVNKCQEGCQQAGDRPLLEVGKKQRWQTAGLRPWGPTVRQLCSIEEQRVNHHNMLIVAASLLITDLALASGKGQGKAPCKQAQR
jgi:hypothetical protein